MINKIIELLEEVATAYTYVQGFSYASPYEMNGAPSMQFPTGVIRGNIVIIA